MKNKIYVFSWTTWFSAGIGIFLILFYIFSNLNKIDSKQADQKLSELFIDDFALIYSNRASSPYSAPFCDVLVYKEGEFHTISDNNYYENFLSYSAEQKTLWFIVRKSARSGLASGQELYCYNSSSLERKEIFKVDEGYENAILLNSPIFAFTTIDSELIIQNIESKEILLKLSLNPTGVIDFYKSKDHFLAVSMGISWSDPNKIIVIDRHTFKRVEIDLSLAEGSQIIPANKELGFVFVNYKDGFYYYSKFNFDEMKFVELLKEKEPDENTFPALFGDGYVIYEKENSVENTSSLIWYDGRTIHEMLQARYIGNAIFLD